jgi:hypothetical protein
LWESGGAGVVGVELLISDRGEHPEGAMTSGPVVEHLDPVEDLRRQFGAVVPIGALARFDRPLPSIAGYDELLEATP